VTRPSSGSKRHLTARPCIFSRAVRGLLPECDIRLDALDDCELLRPVYPGGHGVVYYIPGSGQSTERGERLLMWGYYLQVPESALASVLVDDQERQQSGSVPFGKVHREVRAALESRLAGLLPPSLFELVQQSGNSSIQAIYSFAPRSYARDRLCLVGDAVRCSPRSRGVASSGRWPMPPH
jgi:2-polyprenyl-6-methoxyphenol hydroxylase-like FAD-dependent oxidoreductase